MNLSAKSALFGLLLLVWSNLLHAENEDRNKPIHLESDSVIIDDAKKTSVFEGKVQLTQGTLLIQADRLVITQDKEGHEHYTATGKLASFRQKHEGSDEYIEGYGQRIEYDTRAETVDFYGKARVKRAQDDVQGDHIAYSTRTEIFQVSGGTTSAEDPMQGRVHAVIQPKTKEGAGDAARKGAPLTIQPSTTLSNPKP